jgi:hypothetical protein
MAPDNGDVNTCLVNSHPDFADRIGRIQALAKGYGRVSHRADSSNYQKPFYLIA